MTSVLMKRGHLDTRGTHTGRIPCEGEGRGRGDVVEVKEHPRGPAPTRGQKRGREQILAWHLQRQPGPAHTWPPTGSLQNCQAIVFVLLKALGGWYLATAFLQINIIAITMDNETLIFFSSWK